ncbi:MAG: SH3 domain-containing protein [Bacteroidia bacterium]|nr:SH3 domain-containing protein [Bacteroidia bacterium]
MNHSFYPPSFRNFGLLLAVVFLLSSCATKNQPPANSASADSLTTDSPDQSAPTSAPRFNALIAGNGVRARELPSLEDSVLRTFQAGEAVEVIQPNGSRISITTGDECDEYGYSWFEVKDANGKLSFVFGKFLFITPSEGFGAPWYEPFEMAGQTWSAGIALDQSYGPSDEEGLTSCDKLFMPYFFRPGETTLYPVYYDPKALPDTDLEWGSSRFNSGILSMIHSSDGGTVQLDKVVPVLGEKAADLYFTFTYQDGERKAAIRMGEKNGKFHVTAVKNL